MSPLSSGLIVKFKWSAPPVEVSKEHWGEYIECDGDKASWGRGDKEADEDRRTGAFAKIFWLSCALMRRYGGPNGIRTRVTDVRGRCPNH
jgi:hypothetical protein